MFDHRKHFEDLRRAIDLRAVDSLEEVEEDTRVLHITGKTKSLERLPQLSKLRILAAHDIQDAHFRLLCEATQITHLSANAFRLPTLEPIAALRNLEALELTDNTKFSSLEGLESLSRLKLLSLGNCPISASLEPIAACRELRYLWISSRYSKAMRTDSLAPLAELKYLERLRLTNVRVADKRLDVLTGLKYLVEIDLPNFFPRDQFTALAAALPGASGSLRKWAELSALGR